MQSRRCGDDHSWSRGEHGATFTLQSMVLEYVTDRLVENSADEIVRAQPALLVHQPVMKALAKDYVRQSQERLISEPILHQLLAKRDTREVEQQLVALLDGWQERSHQAQGY